MFSHSKVSAAQFLKQYWQRKPLLLRQAFPDFQDPITPEELAGLACEQEVESRLVFTEPTNWRLQNGPFVERDFTSLPDRDWTLLVQAVDQWVAEVKQLMQSVAFLPAWRVDDIMISFATAGGGVGPHFDYYDVFLVQGQGSRIWRTGQRCSAEDELRTDSGLKLLDHFGTVAEYELHSGDVLYVPPGVAHWGISNDDSLSYSIGFRAPSLSDMLIGFSDHLSDQLSADQRYTDPKLQSDIAQGEISAAALQQARKSLLALLDDDRALAQWFGGAMTQPRYPDSIEPRKKLTPSMQQAAQYRLHPASRLAWGLQDESLLVFSDGECSSWPDSAALRKLCQQLATPGADISATATTRNAACRALRDHLLLRGNLLPERRR
jgi:50S ribosomal protein L16 3-hydroxylase